MKKKYQCVNCKSLFKAKEIESKMGRYTCLHHVSCPECGQNAIDYSCDKYDPAVQA